MRRHPKPEGFLSGHDRSLLSLVARCRGEDCLPRLDPGATYRFTDPTTYRDPDGPQIRKEFSVKSGEPLELGDILIEKPSAGE